MNALPAKDNKIFIVGADELEVRRTELDFWASGVLPESTEMLKVSDNFTQAFIDSGVCRLLWGNAYFTYVTREVIEGASIHDFQNN